MSVALRTPSINDATAIATLAGLGYALRKTQHCSDRALRA
jgi:hypothetical protein